MATVTKTAIDAIEDWEHLAELENHFRALTEYVRVRKDHQRALVYGQVNRDHPRLVEEAGLLVPDSITF